MNTSYWGLLCVSIFCFLNNFLVSLYYGIVNIDRLVNISYLPSQKGFLITFVILDLISIVFSFIFIVVLLSYSFVNCNTIEEYKRKLHFLLIISMIFTIDSLICILADIGSISYDLWNWETILADFGSLTTNISIIIILLFYINNDIYILSESESQRLITN